MKKLASVLLSTALVASMAAVSVVSASAEVTELPADWDPTAYEYIVVGNAGLLTSAKEWNPTNEEFKMNYDENAGLWYLNLEGAGNTGETFDIDNSPQYKVVVAGYNEANPWEFSFNENGVAYGLDSNSMVDFGEDESVVTADTVTIVFDGYKTTSAIDAPYTPATEDHTYFAVGSSPLFDPAWVPNAEAYQMTKNADGIFEVTIDVTEEMWDSDISYKVTQDGTWDVSFNEQGEALGEGTDAHLYIEIGATQVVITFNPATQCAGASCVMGEEPTEPSEAPTEPSEAPTEEVTEAPTDEATAPTDEATAPTDEATAPTTATTATDATKATSAPTNATTAASNNSNTTTSTTTGKVATGDSTSVAMLIGVLMLAGAGVVAGRKRIAE